MPKITLMNDESGELQDFEPIDAREVLSAENSIYSVPAETRAEIDREGKEAVPQTTTIQTEGGPVNVPQLQSDPEMQVGLPTQKYARGDIVKAQAGNVNVKAVSTSGGSLEGEAVDASDWTKAQMQEHLTQQGVPLRSDMNKAELLELMEQHPPKKKVW